MSASNAFETALLEHIFQNENIDNIGDATGLRGSSTAGVFYIGLHSSDPGEAGDQSSNEVEYDDYARVLVVRSDSGFTVSGNTVENAAEIEFPECAGSTATATHFSIGTDASGGGNLLLSGALDSSLAISNGITPKFDAGALTATAD